MKKKNNTMKDVFTVAQLSKEMGISTRTIHNYIKKGKLKAFKKNNRLYFPKDQFENTEKVSERETEAEGNELVKQLKKEIEGLNKDKEFLQEQLKSQTELARNEQHLKAQLQDKFDKILLLNSPEANRPEGNVYEAQPVKDKKTSYKKTEERKKGVSKTKKKETPLNQKNKKKERRGFWSWLTEN
jgi:DNA-binding transcriptional MerR regulator